MCFVKTLIHKRPTYDSAFKPCDSINFKNIEQDSTPIQEQNSPNREKSQLLQLFQSLLMTNSVALMQISNSVDKIVGKIQSTQQQIVQYQECQDNSQNIEQITNVEPQLNQIFGNKKYKFQLALQQEFPQILYKQRNFNCHIQLLDSKGVPVRNSNIIPLCMGISTINGQWVQQNKGGESIIKGKNEIDMYQGKAQFQKIYLREVSRPYPQGKFNLIIYAKPSTIKYSNQTALEQHVDQNLIMPLLLKDITVRAKKK